MKDHIGEFENLCLLSVWRLQPLAFGLSVRQEIIDRTDRLCVAAAVYATLQRLEAKGYVSVSLRRTAGRPQRGRKQAYVFYAITETGERMARAHRESVERMWDGIE